ncbi:MAG: glycosyltransferase family 2 protein [Planctomycetes bacterium]|nr:glycosyltransferase family 2 protein [Planctomycetota bacterium]
MNLFEATLLVLYFGTLVALCGYGLHRSGTLLLFAWHRRNAPPLVPAESVGVDGLPRVTVQLPIFNERYVAERAIDALAALDYPRDRLQIQILDDSTDDTRALCARAADRWRRRGVDMVHLHRSDRTGFKAGALREGLKSATGELVAIFDADFVPTGDFLWRVIPGFSDGRVGVVQARWGHINRDYSLLTRAQAILLDGHFLVEHTARNRSGRFINFNGTAGVWRRACMEDAGGWEHDTLTEDLDISYRAQMRGWKFVFLPDVVVPAELPSEVHGFKSQQHRWAKGSVQTAIKLGVRILRAPIPVRVKAEAFAHLSANVCYPLLLLLTLLLLPMLWMRTRVLDPGAGLALDVGLFFSASISIVAFYVAAERLSHERRGLRLILELPLVLALGIGLAVNNTRAVLEALVGYETPFVRTPKHAITATSGTWRGKVYFDRKVFSTLLELALGAYLVATVAYAVREEFYISAAFVALFAFGFLYIGGLSLLQAQLGALFKRRKSAPPLPQEPVLAAAS